MATAMVAMRLGNRWVVGVGDASKLPDVKSWTLARRLRGVADDLRKRELVGSGGVPFDGRGLVNAVAPDPLPGAQGTSAFEKI